MADADVARQPHHVTLTKHIAHEAIGLALLQALLTPGHDARRVLATVLQDRQRVVNRLVNG